MRTKRNEKALSSAPCRPARGGDGARWVAWVVVSSGLLACSGGGGGDPVEPDGGRADAAVEPTEATWEPEPRPDGPALWVDATPGTDEVLVTISSRDLGAVFGLSAHLAWDEAVLTLDQGPLATAQAPILDPAGDGAAVMLAAARPGDLALGGTRDAPAAGAVALDDEAILARLRFTRAGAGTTRLDLLRAVVVRIDGTVSAVGVAGGVLVLPEVTP